LSHIGTSTKIQIPTMPRTIRLLTLRHARHE
jgi:hypothetical protein